MRKLILIILFAVLFIPLRCFSQHTLTYADIPHPGDSFIVAVDNSHIVDIGVAGTGPQTWDFSSLVQDSIKFSFYGITSNLSFAGEFPYSNLYSWGPGFIYAGPGSSGPAASAFGYLMSSSTDTGMYIYGYRCNYDGRGEKNVYHDRPEVLVKTPVTFNSPATETNSRWEVPFNLITGNYDTTYISHIHKEVACDAYGEIYLPSGHYFSNVLRIHEYGTITDTIRIIYMGIPFYNYRFKKDTFNFYHFYAPLQRHPVATAYTRTDGSLIRMEYLWISMLGVDAGVPESELIKVYPNPADEMTTITLPTSLTKAAEIRISDAIGRVVISKQIPWGQDKIIIQTSNLDPGIYYITIPGFKLSKKLIIRF